MATIYTGLIIACLTFAGSLAYADDSDVWDSLVPDYALAPAHAETNPLSSTPETIERGKAIFLGKGFCAACHGREGKGLTGIPPGRFENEPRNFTDPIWQQARTDGELMWILRNGSAGTAMAPFIPLVLTEEEAWQVIAYIRQFEAHDQERHIDQTAPVIQELHTESTSGGER